MADSEKQKQKKCSVCDQMGGTDDFRKTEWKKTTGGMCKQCWRILYLKRKMISDDTLNTKVSKVSKQTMSRSRKKDNESICKVCKESFTGKLLDLHCSHCRHMIDAIKKKKAILGNLINASFAQ